MKIPNHEVFWPKHPLKSIFRSWNPKTSYFYEKIQLFYFANFCLQCTSNFYFFEGLRNCSESAFVKLRYLDPRTCDLAQKSPCKIGLRDILSPHPHTQLKIYLDWSPLSYCAHVPYYNSYMDIYVNKIIVNSTPSSDLFEVISQHFPCYWGWLLIITNNLCIKKVI